MRPSSSSKSKCLRKPACTSASQYHTSPMAMERKPPPGVCGLKKAVQLRCVAWQSLNLLTHIDSESGKADKVALVAKALKEKAVSGQCVHPGCGPKQVLAMWRSMTCSPCWCIRVQSLLCINMRVVLFLRPRSVIDWAVNIVRA